ncbi:Isochorismatase hydrolase [Phellopilus nigrolimitatus]|nr:Isochorismatase hydrolase [Phellopilus nigrolimitatus]
MQTRPLVEKPTEYGNAASFWVEYPSGLVDLTRSTHLAAASGEDDTIDDGASDPPCMRGQLDVAVDGARTVRFDAKSSALVVIDMQNFFLHPDLRNHPKGLACVQPLLDVIPPLRTAGVKIIWVNWGLTEHELQTIPPSLVRGFMKNNTDGLGSELQGGFGRKLMRDAYNSELYGPLQAEYVKGKEQGTDVWIHKNRMSALWGPQSSLDLYLQEEGINTLFFSGVNADQCVLGTVVDSYYRGYDIVLIKDATATTSPAGGLENICYNIGNSYGFLSDSVRVAEGASRK